MREDTPTKRSSSRLRLQEVKSTPKVEELKASSPGDEFLAVKRPLSRVTFTDAAKQQLIAALESHQFNTVKEAHEWMRTQLGVHVTYTVVWRFVRTKGLLVGGTFHSRRLVQGA